MYLILLLGLLHACLGDSGLLFNGAYVCETGNESGEGDFLRFFPNGSATTWLYDESATWAEASWAEGRYERLGEWKWEASGNLVNALYWNGNPPFWKDTAGLGRGPNTNPGFLVLDDGLTLFQPVGGAVFRFLPSQPPLLDVSYHFPRDPQERAPVSWILSTITFQSNGWMVGPPGVAPYTVSEEEGFWVVKGGEGFSDFKFYSFGTSIKGATLLRPTYYPRGTVSNFYSRGIFLEGLLTNATAVASPIRFDGAYMLTTKDKGFLRFFPDGTASDNLKKPSLDYTDGKSPTTSDLVWKYSSLKNVLQVRRLLNRNGITPPKAYKNYQVSEDGLTLFQATEGLTYMFLPSSPPLLDVTYTAQPTILVTQSVPEKNQVVFQSNGQLRTAERELISYNISMVDDVWLVQAVQPDYDFYCFGSFVKAVNRGVVMEHSEY